MPTTTRKELHTLVDRLPEHDLMAARELLEDLLRTTPRPSLDEILANVPYDDEELTAEDIAAIEQAKADVVSGNYVTDEELGRILETRRQREG